MKLDHILNSNLSEADKLAAISEWRKGVMTQDEILTVIGRATSTPSFRLSEDLPKEDLWEIIRSGNVPKDQLRQLGLDPTKAEMVACIKLNIRHIPMDPGGYIKTTTKEGKEASKIKSQTSNGHGIRPDRITRLLEAYGFEGDHEIIYNVRDPFPVGSRVTVEDNGRKCPGVVVSVHNLFQRVVEYSTPNGTQEQAFTITEIQH